jgi:REP element-mobilizing transposase RayT
MPGFTPFHGKAPRYRGFDYRSAGWYFVTLVTLDRQRIFGSVTRGELRLSRAGRLCGEEWRKAVDLRPHMKLGRFVVMPDHLHALVALRPGLISLGGDRLVPAGSLTRAPRSLGAMIACFKASLTSRLNAVSGTDGRRIWQRGYHDRVVRDDRELSAIDRYIRDNPRRLVASIRRPPTDRGGAS